MKKIITLLFAITLITSCKDKKEAKLKDLPIVSEIEDTKEPEEIIQVVTAKSGLRFRDKPKGKTISKFKYNARITIVEYTGITEKIKNGEEIITGEWVGVKHHENTVYVFDGFLSDPVEKVIDKATINPIDMAILQAYIIKPGSYHGDEIPDNMTTENWFGIFNDDGNYLVKKAAITISKIHDDAIDSGGQKSGKKIIENDSENCYLLINNVSYLTERNIDTILTKPIIIHPKKPYSFTYNHVDYTLSATAKDYESLNLNINYFKAEGYKLYLEKVENEVITKQLLLFERYFDNQITQILFIGDIDGDTIPDLIIDSSNNSSETVPTLYLSKEANPKEIVKIVSLHKSVSY